MAINLVVNSTSYPFPQTGDSNWGDNATAWAQAVTSGMLQKAGGIFQLTAEVDFGTAFGVKSLYFLSRSANAASTGQVRLANTDTVSFRNAGNTGDLALTAGSSDAVPQYNSVDLANISSAQTLTNKTISGASNTITNIAYSALALTGAIVNADISASAAIAYSKLSLSGAVVNSDISGSAAIAYSKLSLGNSIVNADVNASAAIALSKLAALSSHNRVLVSDSSGFISESSVTSTALGYLDATSSIQTQLNAKQASGNYVTALTGDVAASGPGSVAATIQANVVSNSKLVQMAAHTYKGNNTGSTANASDVTAAQVLADISPLSAKGDLHTFDTANARLPVGTNNYVLTADSSQSSGLKWAKANGGGGLINFVGMDSTWNVATSDDINFENGLGAWALFNNSASAIPSTMTGGTPTGNVAFARTTTVGEFIDGAASAKITKSAANAQGDGVATSNVYIPTAYRGQTLVASLPFKVLSGSIVSGDINLFAYDVTNSALITPFNNAVVGSQGVLVATFPISTNTAQIRIGFYFSSTSATAVTLVFDDVLLTPASAMTVLGMAGSNTKNDLVWSASAGFGTPAFLDVQYRQVGDRMVGNAYITAGTVAASVAYLQLPAGKFLDTSSSKLPTGKTTKVGEGTLIASAGPASDNATAIKVKLFYDGSTNDKLFISYQSQSGAYVKNSVSAIFNSGDGMSAQFDIPIAGWDANVTMAQSAAFWLSSYLANGSRVTGTAPTALGQYRTYLRGAASNTFSETNGAPSAAPSATNGMAIYFNTAYGSADASNQPSKYEMFVGKGLPSVRVKFWSGTGRTGFIDVSPVLHSTDSMGFTCYYDDTTGILTVVKYAGNKTALYAGSDATGDTYLTTSPVYFDVQVAQNALAVGVQAPRSEVFMTGGSGYGSTNTVVQRFTTLVSQTGSGILVSQSSTLGDSFTLLEDGIWYLNYTQGATTTWESGITKNSTQLTTAPEAITSADRLAYVEGVTNTVIPAVFEGFLPAGTVIRMTGNGNRTDAARVSARITKVSN